MGEFIEQQVTTFFDDAEKNKLSNIAKASHQWQLIEERKNEGSRYQRWRCTYKHAQTARSPVMVFSLAEGFADDEVRFWEFKRALVESEISYRDQTEILFANVFGGLGS